MPRPHYIEVAGDAYAIGVAHGSELRQQVTACVDFYRSILGLGEEELSRRAAMFAALITEYAPEQAEEIRGIAAGAGLPVEHIFAINARSELVPFTATECTTLWAPGRSVLGQTWDWCEQLEELVSVIAITLADGHRLLSVTEPGIVAKVGLSSAGLGVCLNFLTAPRSSDGVPIHSLLRAALDAPSITQAGERLRRAGAGRGGNVLVAARDGTALNFEFAGDMLEERRIADDFVHTNHCLFSPVSAGDMQDNSQTRFDRATQLLASHPEPGIDQVKSVLSDNSNADAPICAPYHTLFGLELGTICTVVMDLEKGQMHFRMGSDPQALFELFSL